MVFLFLSIVYFLSFQVTERIDNKQQKAVKRKYALITPQHNRRCVRVFLEWVTVWMSEWVLSECVVCWFCLFILLWISWFSDDLNFSFLHVVGYCYIKQFGDRLTNF